MTPRATRHDRWPGQLTLAVSLAALFVGGWGGCRREGAPAPVESATPAPAPSSMPEPKATPVAPETWAAAIATVEERRSSSGRIEVPSELQHYDDRRRFLALQM